MWVKSQSEELNLSFAETNFTSHLIQENGIHYFTLDQAKSFFQMLFMTPENSGSNYRS